MKLHRECGDRNCSLALRVLSFAFTSLLLLGAAFGQSNQGSIAGNIFDPSGALVGAAKISAREVSTGAVYETVSSSAGAFKLPNMSIGTYDVTATAPGFKTATYRGVVVQVATTSALDIRLQTGTVSETVSVNADVPTVQSESSDIGTVVTTKQILDLLFLWAAPFRLCVRPRPSRF
jgi:Carboxypeptidase regulatory-like domain